MNQEKVARFIKLYSGGPDVFKKIFKERLYRRKGMKPTERLHELRKAHQAHPPEQFSWDTWYVEGSCGTLSCIAGYGASWPALQKEGLLLEAYNKLDLAFDVVIPSAEIRREDAFAEFFGITPGEVEALIYSSYSQMLINNLVTEDELAKFGVVSPEGIQDLKRQEQYDLATLILDRLCKRYSL